MPELRVHLQDAKQTISITKGYPIDLNDTGQALIDKVRTDLESLVPSEEPVLDVTLAGYTVVDVSIFAPPTWRTPQSQNIPFHLVGLSHHTSKQSGKSSVYGAVESSLNNSSVVARVSPDSPLCPIAATQAYRQKKGQNIQDLQVWFSTSQNSGPGSSLDIVVKTFNGSMTHLGNVTSSTQVQSIIDTASSRLHIPKHCTVLVHKGRYLEPDLKLSDYGISVNPGTAPLLSNLRAGFQSITSNSTGSQVDASGSNTVTMYLDEIPMAGMFARSSGRKGYDTLSSLGGVVNAVRDTVGGLLGQEQRAEAAADHWQLMLSSGATVEVPFAHAQTFSGWYSHIEQILLREDGQGQGGK